MARRGARSGTTGIADSSRAHPAWLVLLAVAAACSKSGDGSSAGSRKDEPLRVAAASDLALAFKDIGAAFEKQSGKRVEFSFGSTGLLAKQISEGGPFDVFAAANVSYVDDVVREGACLGETKALYAKGRIVMWAKDPASVPKDLTGLEGPKYAKIALANPEHAPYGRAAREALTKAGVWSTVQPRAVYGENVQQALTFASSGNADVAIVALSLAVTSPGGYTPIDPSFHETLDQALVICRGKTKGARVAEAQAFASFIRSEGGRTIMRRYGFSLPEDSRAR
jgi:molybdate transport system substrate-binding protein